MQSTFFFFLPCIIIAIIFSPFVNSITVNEKSNKNEEHLSEESDNNSCFDSSGFFIARILKIAIITIDVLAPRGVTKSNFINKAKLMLANKQLIDTLRGDMYNVFIMSGGTSYEDKERFNIAFGIPKTKKEKTKMKQLAKKSNTQLATESVSFKNCNIGGLPAQKVDQLGYAISAKKWYDSNKEILLKEKSEDKFKRQGTYCNDEVLVLQYLCEKQLSDKHILNSIIQYIGDRKKILNVKILAIGDNLPYIGHAFEIDKTNKAVGFREDITLMKFHGISSKTATNKNIINLTSQILGFCKDFSKAMSTLPKDKTHHVCEVESHRKIMKKYTVMC